MYKTRLNSLCRVDWPVVVIVLLFLLSHTIPAAVLPYFLFGKEPGDAYVGWECSAGTVYILYAFWDSFGLDAFSRWEEWLPVVGWLPNLWIWCGVACLFGQRRRGRRVWSVMAGIFGLFGLVCGVAWQFSYFESSVLRFLPGYYVWLAPFVLLACIGAWRTIRGIEVPRNAAFDSGLSSFQGVN